jgi:hypothetical protein
VKKLISIAIFTILALTIAVIFSSTSPSNAQYPYPFSPSYPPGLTAPSQYPSYQNPYQSYQNPYQSYQNPYQSYQNPYQSYQNPYQSYQNPYQSYQNPQQPPAANPAPPQYPSPSYQNPQQQPQNSPSQSIQQYQNPSSPTTNVTTSNSTNSSTTTVPRNTQYPPNQQQPQFPPFTSPNPPMSILIVITRVNNTRTGIGVLGSTNTTQLPVATAPSSFSEVVTNAYANPDGYTLAYHYIRGSQMAININLQPGVFTISDLSNNNRTANNPSVIAGNQSPLSLYTPSYSGDCSNTTSAAGIVIGYGQINLGETKTCIITYNNKVNR